LPPAERADLVRCHIGGATLKALAAKSGVSISTVRAHLNVCEAGNVHALSLSRHRAINWVSILEDLVGASDRLAQTARDATSPRTAIAAVTAQSDIISARVALAERVHDLELPDLREAFRELAQALLSADLAGGPDIIARILNAHPAARSALKSAPEMPDR